MNDTANFDMKHTDEIRRQSRGSRLESDRIFSQSFTKYVMSTNKFIKPKSLKYVSQFGGVPLGQLKDGTEILVDSSDSHSLIIGATGSKKSRLVVMPSVYILAYAGESMIVSDPKAEIYGRTAALLLKQGYKIEVINLREPSLGNSWNPLSIPYSFYKNGNIDKACEFINDISTNLMLSEKSDKDPYWDYSAGDLFFGLTLLLFKYCKTFNLNDGQVNITNLLRLRKDFFGNGTADLLFLRELVDSDTIISSSLMGTIEAPDKTQSCILSTFDEKMRCFMIQPNLLKMLSNNSISMDCICDKKTIIYLIMPDEKTSYHKLITLFVKQSYEYLIYKAQANKDGKMPIRVNYILDEFSSLPTIKDFPTMITAARSRNMRFNLVIQSKHQLIQRYKEEAETIQSNCDNWVFLTSREIKLLEEISRLCGTHTNSNKPIIPLDSLQHFNKEKGEALILSGRLYPYVSHLVDINMYDNGNFSFLDFKEEVRDCNEIIRFSSIVSNDFTEQLENKLENKLEYKEEIEKKFDELFGEFNESEDNE